MHRHFSCNQGNVFWFVIHLAQRASYLKWLQHMHATGDLKQSALHALTLQGAGPARPGLGPAHGPWPIGPGSGPGPWALAGPMALAHVGFRVEEPSI